MSRRVFLEPLGGLHSSYDSLFESPPDGYEFVMVKHLSAEVAKQMLRFGFPVPLYYQIGRLVPVNLFRALVHSFQKRPPGVALTLSVNHLVFRKEPWILDMPCAPPFLLAMASPEFFPSTLKNIVARVLCSSYCRAILCRFEAHRREFLSFYGNDSVARKAEVIYWGVPKKDFAKDYSQKEDVKLLFINSVNFNTYQHFCVKGGRELVEAFLALGQRYPNLELVMRSAVPPDIARKLEGKKVRIIDSPLPRGDLEHEWRSADIFVLPTLDPPLLGLLEAMSYGLPIVTTDLKANLEIVQDGKSACLVHRPSMLVLDKPPMLDSALAKQLCERLSLLIENAELRRKIGLEARRVAEEKFTLEQRNARLEKVLDRAARSISGGAK